MPVRPTTPSGEGLREWARVLAAVDRAVQGLDSPGTLAPVRWLLAA